MKIVKIAGGLGNQMFQYAFSKELEARTGEKVYLDTVSAYKRNVLHNGFELQKIFNIDYPEAPAADVERLATQPNSFFNRIHRKYFTKSTHIIARSSGYVPGVFDLSGDRYFEGYWQSEKYFSSSGDNIRKAFTFIPTLSVRSEELLQHMTRPSLSIHVRRGDYLNAKNVNLNVCTLQYYRNAIAAMTSLHKIESCIIFSDDIQWCRDYIKPDIPHVYYADWNTGANSWQDMALMSKCSHHIISNSSFSWWGAWLSANTDKTVMVPALWDKRERKSMLQYYSFTSTDIIPSSWIRISI